MHLLSKTEAIAILTKFIETELPTKDWFVKVESSIFAMILYGSTAKGTNRADSDIDMLIILPLAQEQAHTVGEYIYPFEGYEINIVLRSIEGLQKYATDTDRTFQAEVFRESHILWERDSSVRELITEIKNAN